MGHRNSFSRRLHARCDDEATADEHYGDKQPVPLAPTERMHQIIGLAFCKRCAHSYQCLTLYTTEW
ncbi:MAG: hypothetical protein NVS4B8_06240 [Herpetosiphon sp.]